MINYCHSKKGLSLTAQLRGFANNALGVEVANANEFMNKLTKLRIK